jgi:hypothetical protein
MKIKFDSSILQPLLEALSNEIERWDNACSAEDISTLAKNNFERDMVYFDELILGVEWYFSKGEDAEFLLSSREVGYIVEALDNEIDLKRPSSPNFNQERWMIIKDTRDRIKNAAIECFGDRFLKLIHYDRARR